MPLELTLIKIKVRPRCTVSQKMSVSVDTAALVLSDSHPGSFPVRASSQARQKPDPQAAP